MNFKPLFFVLFVVFFLYTHQNDIFANDLVCKTPQGTPISWFTQFKFPRTVQKSQSFKVAYYDKETQSDDVILMKSQVSEEGDAIYETLKFANDMEDLIAIAWNDQAPDAVTNEVENAEENSSTSAHSKCILALDQKSSKGYLIVHSIPKFPKIADSKFVLNQFDDNQNIYGQSMICMSLTGEQLNDLAKQILIENPEVYFKKNIDKLDKKYPYISSLANEQYKNIPHDVVYKFQLIDDTEFTAFIKSGKKPAESIFEKYMIPYFGSSMLTETWGRPAYIPSSCSENGPSIYNIQELNFGNQRVWTCAQDHSKWCLTSDITQVCIGGMNHVESQNSRGGSMYCQNNPKLHSILYSKINKLENCPILKFLQKQK